MPTRPKVTEPRDNEQYWIDRHERLQHKLSAVGDIQSSEGRNLELYATKKRRVASLLRAMDALDLGRRSVLDAGCGIGMLSELFYALGAQVGGVDASETAIAEARMRCPDGLFEAGSLLDFDLGRRFDLVFCVDVLYHVVDDANWSRALERLVAHAEPAGRVVILDQLKPEPLSPAPHVRFRTGEMYAQAFERLGMREATPEGHGAFLVFSA